MRTITAATNWPRGRRASSYNGTGVPPATQRGDAIEAAESLSMDFETQAEPLRTKADQQLRSQVGQAVSLPASKV